jgi:aryl-alcohol dehydrogenase-like predicted oxidoreductase
MRRRRLGASGLLVSEVGLGTMNFGSQLGESESHAILDAAVEAGINFIDTAELYASPPEPATQGRSEAIIGSWLAGRARDSILIATKVVGPIDGLYQSGAHLRGGLAALDGFHIGRALDASLRRLRSDYVDLLMFHWPDRHVPVEAQLRAVERAITQGKARYFGCSNETAWGLMRMIAASERHGLPRPVGVQNVLSLLEPEGLADVAEVCREERLGFIGYSPLAMGLLSGKYRGSDLPAGSRFARYPRYRQRYATDTNHAIVERLEAAAQRRGIPLAELAFAWALTRPEVSTILTSVSRPDQLALARHAAARAAAHPQDDLDEGVTG